MSRTFPPSFTLAGYPNATFRVHPTCVGPMLKLQLHLNGVWRDLNARPIHEDDLANRITTVPAVVNLDSVAPEPHQYLVARDFEMGTAYLRDSAGPGLAWTTREYATVYTEDQALAITARVNWSYTVALTYCDCLEPIHGAGAFCEACRKPLPEADASRCECDCSYSIDGTTCDSCKKPIA